MPPPPAPPAGRIRRRDRVRRHLHSRRPRPRVVIGLLGAALALLGGLVMDVPGLEPQGERMLGIFLAAIVL
ncbi:hypothetical protein [Actinomyces provencensis]|uniref:hypothetical protein n=1 Tax=Actinomyces provencensis TaxID=1720198 RepID=UPI00096A627E|nr:hypothetical protein [Actinomyces provencensis]